VSEKTKAKRGDCDACGYQQSSQGEPCNSCMWLCNGAHDHWKPSAQEHVDQLVMSAELIRLARSDGTRPIAVVTEERWHALADALDALAGLLAPKQTKDGCVYCPPFGMSSEELPSNGRRRCAGCGKLWRGRCTDKGTMWHEVPE
jgi:hypothetical protein